MSKNKKYKYKGSTRIDHFEPIPPKDPWDTIGPIVLVLFILFCFAKCSGAA